MDLPILVVTWNGAEKIARWLESMKNIIQPLRFQPKPIIIDNGSCDKTPTIIRKEIESGFIEEKNVFWMHENLGFAKAQNFAIRQLMGRSDLDYFATLNEDAEASPNWLCSLIREAVENSSTENKVGMWCGPILCPEPNNQMISSNGHWLRRRDGAFLDIDWNKPFGHKDNYMKKGEEPFSPCFAAALWSLKMISEVGLNDNDQFLYYDDVELAYRARLAGWRARFVDDALASHPLPRPKPKNSRDWRIQQEGRLLIAIRYFPESEQTRIFASLGPEEGSVLDGLRSSRRDLTSRYSNDMRKEIWKEWVVKFDNAS